MTTIDTEARVALAQSLATTAAKRRRNAMAQHRDASGRFVSAVIAQTVADDADSIEPTPWYVWLLLGIVIGLALCFAWAVAGPVVGVIG